MHLSMIGCNLQYEARTRIIPKYAPAPQVVQKKSKKGHEPEGLSFPNPNFI